MRRIDMVLIGVILMLGAIFVFTLDKGKVDVDIVNASEEDYVKYIVNEPGDKFINGYSVATFSGGCFWCSEKDFQSYDGVLAVFSGYSDGDEPNPTYQQVVSGNTKYREAIQVIYDSEKISYPRLLEVYWRHIDPTDEGGQFADRGYQYTTAIYYHDGNQKFAAEKSKEMLGESGKYEEEIVTQILPFKNFYLAEDYHQDYSEKNPVRYSAYRTGSGRQGYIDSLWGDDYPDLEEACTLDLEKLTPEQYEITQKGATEKPFENEYWNNTDEGIYVDVVSGEPLFSSTDKFESDSGWPSFSKPISENEIIESLDLSHGMYRTEIRSFEANSHLGHLFNDGPEELGGMRYCVNSGSLKFIPRDKMEEEGYGRYLYLFE